MNFNVYVSKQVAEDLARAAKAAHRSRNSIVMEALQEWITNHAKSGWPEGFFDFTPITDAPDFKALRKEFKNIPEDPLA